MVIPVCNFLLFCLLPRKAPGKVDRKEDPALETDLKNLGDS